MGVSKMASIWRPCQTKDDVFNGVETVEPRIFPNKISMGISMLKFGRDLGRRFAGRIEEKQEI